MLSLIQNAVEDDHALLQKVQQNLNSAPPNLSHARIIANEVLARAIYEGDANPVTQAAERVRDILIKWKNSEHDWGRDYELEEVSWIIQHANEIRVSSERVRDGLETIRRLG